VKPAGATITAATAWLNALRARDASGLAGRTSFPFALRDTGTEGDCKKGMAPSEEAFAAAVACLVSDDLVVEDLRANPEPLTKILTAKTLPGWARKWTKEIHQGVTPVSVYIPGNGNTFEFVLLVAGDQIQGLWKNAWFESN